MTPEQVTKTAAKYREAVVSCIAAAPGPDYATPGALLNPTMVQAARHAVHMCDKIPEIVAEGNVEKAMRWLGFVQGVLWVIGIRSIDDMKDDNR